MTLCREETVPLEEFKSHRWSYQGPQSIPWALSWGPAENVLTRERWGFVTITTFHGMMDDKIWKNILLAHPLGKSHIEFTFRLHNLTRQPSVFFLFRCYSCKKSDELRQVSPHLYSARLYKYRIVFSPKKHYYPWDVYETAILVWCSPCKCRLTSVRSVNAEV